MSTTNTIKFNVGGRPFEVSRDLMDKHSESMLGKLVSEAWQADPEEAVFIDRNGDTFAYVLDYLRYGSIELPHTIPRSSFERDLDFYGLCIKEGDIKDNSLLAVLESLQAAKVKHDMLLLAIEAHHQYAFKKKDPSFLVSVKDLRDQLDTKHGTAFDEKLFANYLDVYFGLKATYYPHSTPMYYLYKG